MARVQGVRPTPIYLTGTDAQGKKIEQLVGKVIEHRKHGLVLLHVQYGFFHHNGTDCFFAMDHAAIGLLRAWGIDLIYHFEGPKRDGPIDKRRYGPEGETRDTMWKATLDAIAAAPVYDFKSPPFGRRDRHYLAARHWEVLHPVVERIGPRGEYLYEYGEHLLLTSPYYRDREEIDLGGEF